MTSVNHNSEISFFKNRQLLGSFGEFCYKKFAIDKGYKVQKIGILEYDYLLEDKFKIDVKTTESGKNYYSGSRVSGDICYDVISIKGQTVSVYPDSKSPLSKFIGVKIGDLIALHEEWLGNRINGPKKSKIENAHKKKRNAIIAKIKEIEPSKKIRVIFRGSVSNTRWSSLPDNLPGSNSIIRRFYATIFVQMLTVNDEEEISKIYLFKHSDLKLISMRTPDTRQKNKGISQIIDLEWYEANFGSHIYNSLEQFKKSFEQMV